MAQFPVGAASSRERKSCAIANFASSRLEAAPTTKIAWITIEVSISIKLAAFQASSCARMKRLGMTNEI